MRTTISLDDRLGEALKARARAEGVSFSALVVRLLREASTPCVDAEDEPPLELATVGGAPRPGIDLDRISALLVSNDESAERRHRLAGG